MAKLTKTNRAILPDGTIDFEQNQSMGTKRLTNMANPTNGTDAANKQYTDGAYSHGTTGYQVLPSGLVFQWGSAGVVMTAGQSYGTLTVTLPYSSMAAIYNIQAHVDKLATSVILEEWYPVLKSSIISATQFEIAAKWQGSTHVDGTANFWWTVIGK